MSLIKIKKEPEIQYNDLSFVFRNVLFIKTNDGNFTGAHKANPKEIKQLKLNKV